MNKKLQLESRQAILAAVLVFALAIIAIAARSSDNLSESGQDVYQRLIDLERQFTFFQRRIDNMEQRLNDIERRSITASSNAQQGPQNNPDIGQIATEQKIAEQKITLLQEQVLLLSKAIDKLQKRLDEKNEARPEGKAKPESGTEPSTEVKTAPKSKSKPTGIKR